MDTGCILMCQAQGRDVIVRIKVPVYWVLCCSMDETFIQTLPRPCKLYTGFWCPSCESVWSSVDCTLRETQDCVWPEGLSDRCYGGVWPPRVNEGWWLVEELWTVVTRKSLHPDSMLYDRLGQEFVQRESIWQTWTLTICAVAIHHIIVSPCSGHVYCI